VKVKMVELVRIVEEDISDEVFGLLPRYVLLLDEITYNL